MMTNPTTLSEQIVHYKTLLRMPFGTARIAAQAEMCRLRDAIAEATGLSAQAVQEQCQ